MSGPHHTTQESFNRRGRHPDGRADTHLTCATPEIQLSGPQQAGARRQAINAPIQGAAADIIRRAMIRMPSAIAHLPARMLLQVHDELVFEAEAGAVEELISAARRVMAEAAMPAVSLSVRAVPRIDLTSARSVSERYLAASSRTTTSRPIAVLM